MTKTDFYMEKIIRIFTKKKCKENGINLLWY